MEIKINGKDVQLKEAITIEELLVSQKVEMPQYVTVQLNDEFLERASFPATLVQEGDTVEFLYFMGGGQ